jgi:hypothetical protein
MDVTLHEPFRTLAVRTLQVQQNKGRSHFPGPSLRDGSPAWIRTTIHGSKGRCPTVRRPGKKKSKDLSLSLPVPPVSLQGRGPLQ